MITIKKVGSSEVETFRSFNDARVQLGGKSAMNVATVKRFLESKGYDLATLVETKSSGTRRGSRRTAKKSLISNLIEDAKVIDEEAVEELTARKMYIADHGTKSSEFEELIRINEKLAILQNPQVELDSLLKHVTKLYDEHLIGLHVEAIGINEKIDLENAHIEALKINKKLAKAKK